MNAIERIKILGYKFQKIISFGHSCRDSLNGMEQTSKNVKTDVIQQKTGVVYKRQTEYNETWKVKRKGRICEMR